MPNRYRRLAPAAFAAALGLLAGPAESYSRFSSGPPDGFAGEPPNGDSCVLCHSSFPVNSGDGALVVDGLPAQYDPGQTYDVTIRLSDPDQSRWGFMLTVLNAANEGAGTFTITDVTRTQLSDNAMPDPDYVKQTSEGTDNGTADGPVEWAFQWTAPGDDSVVFYVAANAADGNFSTSNDYIYTLQIPLDRVQSTPVEPVSWSRVKALYDR